MKEHYFQNNEWIKIEGQQLSKKTNPHEMFEKYFEGYPQENVDDSKPPIYFASPVNWTNRNGANMIMFVEIGFDTSRERWEVNVLIATNDEGWIDGFKLSHVEQLSGKSFPNREQARTFVKALLNNDYQKTGISLESI